MDINDSLSSSSANSASSTGFSSSKDSSNRSIHFNTTASNRFRNEQRGYCSNIVKTSRYSIFTFLPMNIFEQFHRTSNIYFFVISILTFLKTSPKDPISFIATFIAILSISAVKDAFEDYKRHKRDDEINKIRAQVFYDSSNCFDYKEWREIRVGDIIKVEKNEIFPADILIISSNDTNLGQVFLDTSNLDGETNLKSRNSVEFTRNLSTAEQIATLKGVIECDLPNDDIYKFHGFARFKDNDDSKTPKLSLGINNIAWRGCVLRNTKWVIGLCVYTGKDSKIMLNAHETPAKYTNVQKTLNKLMYGLFAIQFMFVVLCSAFGTIYIQNYRVHYYLYLQQEEYTGFVQFLVYVITFFVTYSHMIPISLYVAKEIIQTVLAYLINNDIKMYYNPTNTPALAATGNLIEELGQVQYIFTDKTGTLTQNCMVFKQCAINGIFYGESPVEDQKSLEHHREFKETKDECDSALNSPSTQRRRHSLFCFDDNKIKDMIREYTLNNGNNVSEDIKLMYEFWEAICLCHSVMPAYDPEEGRIIYQASSPDEGALLQKASDIGMKFVSRDPHHIKICIYNNELTYEVLNILPFTSERKRMSIIVKCPNGQIKLCCKGADQVIRDRLDNINIAQERAFSDVRSFARHGLRTLVICSRLIDEKLYNDWHPHYNRAMCAISERQIRMDKQSDIIEQKLCLLGVSAIEDKLQDGVAPCIKQLSRAGMQIWMLTGDMRETAVNIGRSCGLITPAMSLVTLSENSFESTAVQIDILIKQQNFDLPSNIELNKIYPMGEADQIALVVDGKTLAFALQKPLKEKFLLIAKNVKICICCRATPLQKSQVVSLVKNDIHAITLAIGDGANDCSMIQTANIGVGVYGEEGMQAVRSADYSIAQFRFLSRLLLIHGRYGYRRITSFVCYYFYKNIASALMDFCFAWFNGFSGQIWFADYLSLNYNALWTSWAVLANGILDKDIPERVVFKNPEIYKKGINNEDFNAKVFFGWILSSIFVCVGGFWLLFFSLAIDPSSSMGYSNDIFYISTCSFFIVILSVSFRLALATYSWTIYHHIAIWGIQILFFIICLVFLSFEPMSSFSGNIKLHYVAFQLFSSPLFWILVFTAPIINLIPNIISMHYHRNISSEIDPIFILQEKCQEERKYNLLIEKLEGF